MIFSSLLLLLLFTAFLILQFTTVVGATTILDDRLCEGGGSKMPWKTTYCYEQSNRQNCWDERPTNLPNCTLEHALENSNDGCFFTNLQCVNNYFESNDYKDTNYTIVRCNSITRYFADATESSSILESVVCSGGFSIYNRWNELGKIGTSKTACNSNNSLWKLLCCYTKPGYSFRDGVCSERQKYLGDDCGDEWGICNNDDGDGSGYQLSCYQRNGTSKAKCYPTTNDMQQKRCSCTTFPTETCASRDCNGHRCIRDGNFQYECDWNGGNNF